MKFGIVVGKDNQKAEELSAVIGDYLVSKGQEIVDAVEKAEVAIVLGGDGTLIHVACSHAESGVPFVGINAGTLGFLTAAEAGDWQTAVDKLISGDYVVSERMTLEARKTDKAHPRGVQGSSQAHPGGEKSGLYRAVNEVVIKGMYRVVKVEILVNGQKFLSASGDGVIIATQTGSTAYSLSAGGPIVDPELDCILITPVNAHGLPIPSVVLSPDDVILVKVVDGEDVSLIIDGHEHTKVSMGQSVKVSRGEHKVKLVYFDKHHFLKALNGKFGLAGRFAR